MNEELRSILCQMDPLLNKLKACPPETFPTRKKLPDCGIYVFYEDKQPIYVGRSGKGTIQKRLINSVNQRRCPLALRISIFVPRGLMHSPL